MPKRRWVVRGLLLFALAFTNLNDIWSPDVIPNALFAWTVLGERNLDYDEFTGPPDGAASDKLDREAYFFRACGVSTAVLPAKAPRSIGGPPAPVGGGPVVAIGALAALQLEPLAGRHGVDDFTGDAE